MPTAVIPPPLPAVERISPAKARRLLTANHHNRNLRETRVTQLANAMARGEWEMNGETIKIAADGTLLDGQHRLQAVVESGVAIKSVVVRGLPPEVQDTVDTGRRRRIADVLAIEGHSDTHALAAAINSLHRYRNGLRMDYSNEGAPTVQQALDLLARTPELPDSVVVARLVTKDIGGPIGVFAALHRAFSEIAPEEAADFYARLADGAQLAVGDPVHSLRRQLIRAGVGSSYVQPPRHVAALTIKAFNLRRAGRSIELLLFRKSEDFPAVERQGQMVAIDGP